MGVRPSLYPRLSLEDCERERFDPRPSPTRGWEKEWDLVPRMCFKKLLYLPLTMAAWTLKKRLRHKLWKIPYVLVVCWELVGTKLCFQDYITFFSDLLPFNLLRSVPVWLFLEVGTGNEHQKKLLFSFWQWKPFIWNRLSAGFRLSCFVGPQLKRPEMLVHYKITIWSILKIIELSILNVMIEFEASHIRISKIVF